MSGAGKSEEYKEKCHFGGLDAAILDGLFKKELSELNKKKGDKFKLFSLNDQVLLKAKTPTLLASVKNELDQMVYSVKDKCKDSSLAVHTKEEKDKIQRYMDEILKETKYDGDLIYIIGKAGNATTIRFYSKDEKKATKVRDHIEKTLLERSTGTAKSKESSSEVEKPTKAKQNSARDKSEIVRPKSGKSKARQNSESVHVPPSFMAPSKVHDSDRPKANSVVVPLIKDRHAPHGAHVSDKENNSTTNRSVTETKEENGPSDRVAHGVAAPNTHDFYLEADSFEDASHGSSRPYRPQNYDKSIFVNGLKVRFVLIPLTKIQADAIVNAANESLTNGAGVAKSIAQEAGKSYQDECKRIVKEGGTIPVSQNVVTKAYKLSNCKWVINAVGPDWRDYSDKEEALKDLAWTVENILNTSTEKKIKVVAMPPISSGLYEFPKEACAAMYSKGIKDFTWTSSSSQVNELILVDLKDSTILDMTYNCLTECVNHGMKIRLKDVLKSLPKKQALGGAKGGIIDGAENSKSKSIKDTSTATKRLCSHIKDKDNDVFNFGKSVQVQIYTADILQVPDVDILVTPESRSFKGDGILARKIIESAGKEYAKERSKLEGQPKQTGEILVTGAGKLYFKKIFHVILSRFDDRGPPNDSQLNQFTALIKNILTRANDMNQKKVKYHSIALPLLGTGHIKDPWFLAKIAGSVFDGIYRFSTLSKTSLREIHLVNINEDTTSAIYRIFINEATGQQQPSPKPGVKETEERNILVEFPKETLKTVDKWRTDTKNKAGVDLESCMIVKGNLSIIDDDESDNSCVVCIEPMDQPVILRACGHQFCRDCIMDYFSRKPSCPMCNTLYGKLYGDQPDDAVASVFFDTASLPGHEGYGTYIIDYEIPNGKQTDQHPNPGVSFRGIRRSAFLPDTKEGQKLLQLLKEAFTQGLIFTIGFSRTTGKDNVLTWNDIHHKTRRDGGPQRFGYPDPEYFPRVREELAAKGIR